jgi:hypothetical protein
MYPRRWQLQLTTVAAGADLGLYVLRPVFDPHIALFDSINQGLRIKFPEVCGNLE